MLTERQRYAERLLHLIEAHRELGVEPAEVHLTVADCEELGPRYIVTKSGVRTFSGVPVVIEHVH